MDGARTVGHTAAVAAIEGMIAARPPHAVLIVGPANVGKTTLALDLAAGLLCRPEPDRARPCRECRSCRLVDSGNHPDLHRIAPAGAGGQIRIGDRVDPEQGTIRALIGELALLPVEGGHRVALIEAADRMNEDAQSALLKTLEEPPAGAVLILCAADEERLLPTVRSRCARIRLGPLGVRDIELLLAERGVADPPTGARLARISGGRPGIALNYALAPDAAVIRGEVSRGLLDLLHARRAARLAGARDLLARAGDLDRDLGSAIEPPLPAVARGRGRGRSAARSRGSGTFVTGTGPADDEADPSGEDGTGSEPTPRTSAAERRRAAAQLIEIWRGVARDLALTGFGDHRSVHDPELLEDLDAARGGIAPGDAAVFLDRLVRAGELLEGNVSPELIVDTLAIAWRARAAA